MNEGSGWVKIYRQTIDNPVIMKTAGHIAVWIYLLLNAARKETDILYSGRRVTIGPGQLLTSRSKLCSITKKEPMTARNIRTILEDFEREGQITMEGSAGGTLITVTKWAEYQTGDQPPTNVINRSPTNQKAGHGIPTDGETTGETAGRKIEKGLVTDKPRRELSTGEPTNHRPTTDQHNKNIRNKENNNNNNNIYINNTPATDAHAKDEAAAGTEAKVRIVPTEEAIEAFFENMRKHPEQEIVLRSEEDIKQ